jgi:hypothetical protein
MNRTEQIFKCSIAKALLVFAWLCSLCIADGIGPRLIPFPFSTSEKTHAKFAPGGVEKTCRDGAFQAAATESAALSIPHEEHPPSPDFYRSPNYSFFFSSSPPGRAPPRNF